MLKVMCLVWFPDFTMLKMVCLKKKKNKKKKRRVANICNSVKKIENRAKRLHNFATF